MSAAGDPEGREHVGDEYVTYNRHKPDFPPFPPSSKEEEEAHREAERRAEHEAEHKDERMLGDIYEWPEGSGKALVDPETTFMQVINDMLASQWTMSQSLEQVVDRLARVGTPDTQVSHVVDPSHPLAHTPLRVGFPDPCFPVSRGHPQ